MYRMKQTKLYRSRPLFLVVLSLATSFSLAASPYLEVTLTGTKGGPNVYKGLAGAGTLVTYGDSDSDKKPLRLQFDVGRSTSLRLSEIDVTVDQIQAIFITHTHNDHVDGLATFMQLRWHYFSDLPKIDFVCSSDEIGPTGFIISGTELAEHIADPYIASGEIAARHLQRKNTPEGGPAELINIIAVNRPFEPTLVWSKGEVKVFAIASTHTPDHLSYRVDTPAGNVVIGGDASNDIRKPPRETSTSAAVERLSQGADILVHSSTHPNMGPEAGGGMPAPIFYRQSTVNDLGAMAERAGVRYYMITHLTPPLGQVTRKDGWHIPGAPLEKEDYEASARAGGFTGTVIVGTDLATVRISKE